MNKTTHDCLLVCSRTTYILEVARPRFALFSPLHPGWFRSIQDCAPRLDRLWGHLGVRRFLWNVRSFFRKSVQETERSKRPNICFKVFGFSIFLLLIQCCTQLGALICFPNFVNLRCWEGEPNHWRCARCNSPELWASPGNKKKRGRRGVAYRPRRRLLRWSLVEPLGWHQNRRIQTSKNSWKK